MKRLTANQDSQREFGIPDTRGLFITTDVSEDDQKILHEGLHRHVVANVGDAYKGISIELVIKDREGELIGGLLAWTTLNNLILEHVWIEENYRGKGFGRSLMQEMERIGRSA